jgi:choline-sulfatase
LGDHSAWQKESYFEASCHVPFLLSWPERIPAGICNDSLVALVDLFAIASGAMGKLDIREGVDVLGILSGNAAPRKNLVAVYGAPGTNRFKIMVREGDLKYIFMANGGCEQLFNVKDDPSEIRQRMGDMPEVAARLKTIAEKSLARTNADRALDKGGHLLVLPVADRPLRRIYQFDQSRGVYGFPDSPQDVLKKGPSIW